LRIEERHYKKKRKRNREEEEEEGDASVHIYISIHKIYELTNENDGYVKLIATQRSG
jgi:hypothetical protein